MALSFGSLTVPSNLTVSSNELGTAPILLVDNEKSDISLILYDRIANYLHYFKYNNAELFPYIQPVRKSQYLVLSLNSTNLNIPEVTRNLKRENFTKQVSLKQLGKIIEKVVFDVIPGSTSLVSKLSTDLLIAEALKMTTLEIKNLCKSDPVLAKRVCENKEFLRQLASKYLTSDLEYARNIPDQKDFDYIAKMIKLLYEDLSLGLDFKNVNYYWNSIKFLDKVLINLYKYAIDRPRVSNRIDTKIIDSIVLEYKKDNNEYRYILKIIIPKVFTEEYDLTRIYVSLLLTIIQEIGQDPSKDWDKLVDEIIDQMTDEQFDKLLEISYGEETRELLDLLLKYLPDELKDEYRDKYFGNEFEGDEGDEIEEAELI
jgi:hypothetical protein